MTVLPAASAKTAVFHFLSPWWLVRQKVEELCHGKTKAEVVATLAPRKVAASTTKDRRGRGG